MTMNGRTFLRPKCSLPSALIMSFVQGSWPLPRQHLGQRAKALALSENLETTLETKESETLARFGETRGVLELGF